MARAVVQVKAGGFGKRRVAQELAGLGQFNGGRVQRQPKRCDGLGGPLIDQLVGPTQTGGFGFPGANLFGDVARLASRLPEVGEGNHPSF